MSSLIIIMVSSVSDHQGYGLNSFPGSVPPVTVAQLKKNDLGLGTGE